MMFKSVVFVIFFSPRFVSFSFCKRILVPKWITSSHMVISILYGLLLLYERNKHHSQLFLLQHWHSRAHTGKSREIFRKQFDKCDKITRKY